MADSENMLPLPERPDSGALGRLGPLIDPALAELSFTALLPVLVERACEAVDADGAVLFLVGEDDTFDAQACVGNAVEAVTPVVHRAAATLAPARDGLTAALPLVSEGRLQGVLFAQMADGPVGNDEMALLRVAADRCASAAAAARLQVTERRLHLGADHVRRHLRVVVDASQVLMESVSDYEAALARLADLITSQFAGIAAVYVADADGLRPLVVHAPGLSAEAVDAIAGLPQEALVCVREAMVAGAGLLAKQPGQDPCGVAFAAAGATSYVIAPMTVRGLSFGALVLATTGDMRGYRPSDLAAAEEVARRAALAVEATMLYREARDSADLAETHATRMHNLLDAWLSISVALDGPNGLRTVSDVARRILDAEHAYVVLDGDVVAASPPLAPPRLPAPVLDYLSELRVPARYDDLMAPPEDVAEVLGDAWLVAPMHNSAADVRGHVLVTGAGARCVEFSAEDESLLVLLAHLVSAGLANTHLHRQTRDNEARLSALIDSSPVAIVDLDLSGAIRSWNPAAGALFDWPDDARSGWRASFGEPLRLQVSALATEAIAQRAPVQHDCSFVRDDGAEKTLALFAAPVRDQTGEVTGLLLTATDETERRQLARQFQEAQRLEAVGRMAGGVAHDFNNLLTVILGYADAMLRRLTEDDPQRERVAAISRAGHRGAALTRQLLAVSRRQVVAPIVLRPCDVFTELKGMIGRLVGEDIEVRVTNHGDDRPVRIDKAQLEQVTLNLAANARDAMRGGGELHLETLAATDPSHVIVQVRDTGTGMDEETLVHCLEPFYTTKDTGEGTGLGLAAAYGIVTQNGGTLSVQSTLGEGTSVTFKLPAVDAPLDFTPAVELPTPKSSAAPLSGHVLLVEDEDEVRALVRRLLRERGYIVLQTGSGQQALELLAAYDGPLDLLVTDVVLPGMKGPEIARRVTDVRDVPVLFVSGYAEELFEMPDDLAVTTGYLPKPFTPDDLVDAVRKLIAVSRADGDKDATARTDSPRREPSEASEAHPDSLRSSS